MAPYRLAECTNLAETYAVTLQKNLAITLGLCVQKLKRRTRPNNVVLKKLCVFISFRTVGFERAVLVTGNMATRQIQAGHFAYCRVRTVL